MVLITDHKLQTDFIKIRRATPDDAPAIITGINTICTEGGAFYVTYFIPSPQWEAVLYQPETVPNHLLVVAEWEEQLVGVGRLFPGPSHSFMQHVAESSLFVLKPYRRRGIGTAIMQWMLRWAGQQNLEKITLSVFATNEPALALYRKFDFIQEGCYLRHLKIGAQYVDFLLLSRLIDHP